MREGEGRQREEETGERMVNIQEGCGGRVVLTLTVVALMLKLLML